MLTIALQNGTLLFRTKAPRLTNLDEESTESIEQATARDIDLLPQPQIVIDLSSVRHLTSTNVAMRVCLN